MAAFGSRSFRCFSRAGQAFSFGSRFGSQGRTVLRGQNVRVPLWRQFCLEANATRRVSRRNFNSLARTVSAIPLTGLQQARSLCLILGSPGSGDMIESSGGDDEGLVIPAKEGENDL